MGVFMESMNGGIGDYDNDGDLDLILTGLDHNDVALSKLYENIGSENFSEFTDINLPDLCLTISSRIPPTCFLIFEYFILYFKYFI